MTSADRMTFPTSMELVAIGFGLNRRHRTTRTLVGGNTIYGLTIELEILVMTNL